MVSSRLCSLPLWIVVISFGAFSSADIIDITMRNFNKTVTKMYFSILFLANADCKKCNLVYIKFMAASQPFSNDPQILFGHVKDPLLFKAMNVTKFPALVYYAPGSATPEISKNDLTVEGIITTIAQAMKGDFSRVKREYAVELTEYIYDEFVALPGVYGLILVYENKDAKDHIETFEKIAGSFRNDYLITFGKVNAEVEKSLASENLKLECQQLLRKWTISPSRPLPQYQGLIT